LKGWTWLLIGLASTASAHEGHAPLPSRGATVNAEKGTIILISDSRKALDVRTAGITTTPLPETSLAYVTLVAPWTKHAFVSTRLPGRVAAFKAAPGQVVNAGAPLAEIESLELETLHEELLKARTERTLAERLLETLRESAGAVAGQTLLEAETSLEQLTNAETVGRIKWRSLGLDDPSLDAFLADPSKRVRRLTVTAPIGGTVMQAEVATGRIVQPEDRLFEIVDLSTVWARIGVLEGDADRVKVGGKVEIRLTARPNEPVEATIDAVSPTVDGPGRTLTVWATLVNPTDGEQRWRPGMTGGATLIQANGAKAKVVPAEALVDDGVAPFVLVEEANTQKASEYRRKDVEVVRRTNRFVEVRSGSLFPEDRVVTRGAQQLGRLFVPGVLKLTPEAAASIGLKTAVVERRSLEPSLTVDGVVDLPPESKAAASTRVAGNILRIHADRGRPVKRGDVLAEVQSAEFQNLQLDLVREELAVRLAERRFGSIKSIGGAVPQRQVIEAEAALVGARTRRDTLRRRLEAVGVAPAALSRLVEERALIDAVPIRAPIDGLVAAFDRTLGQAVRAEETLFEIDDASNLLVRGFVAERDAGRLTPGRPARVRFSPNRTEWIPGRFVRTSGAFSAEDQSLSIWVEIDAAGNDAPRPGQLARVAVTLDEPAAPATLVAPPSALVREGSRTYAFVRKPDGSFERRAVTTGIANDLYVEIVTGLADGETVAVRGVAGLRTAHASVR
jgi:cobalt-zinc-cadmium efflux system membrane fusion protein